MVDLTLIVTLRVTLVCHISLSCTPKVAMLSTLMSP